MPWLKMRLALALAGLPGAALAVSGCGPGQTNAPDTNKPPIENNTGDDDDDNGEPDLPPLTADQWCGTPTEAWDRAGAGGPSNQMCPDGVYAEGSNWNVDAANGDMRTEATGETTCCYTRIYREPDIVIGRPLRVGDETRKAACVHGGAWAPDSLVDIALGSDLTDEQRVEIARRWVDNALLEHASVASFARATIELMAVGAPPSLVAAAQRAAADEIRHAQMCFAVASSYARESLSPGPLAAVEPRALDLAGLAVTTFLEGCVPESIGAIEAERLAAAAHDPAVAGMLRDIAADEARHAELAWATVGWAARAGGRPVVEAVLAAARDYELPAPSEAGALDPILAAHGLLADGARAEYMRRGWREIIEPLLADLAEGRALAPAAPTPS